MREREFIELAIERRLQDAIAYAIKHLTPWQETHMREINQAMGLLAFPPDTKCQPYKVLVDDNGWSITTDLPINSVSFCLFCRRRDSMTSRDGKT